MHQRYFTNGTERTITGATVGMEIETDFVMEDGSPISSTTTSGLLRYEKGRPGSCQVKLELGRQKLELSLAPQASTELLLESANTALAWLYKAAAQFGARPLFKPEIQWAGNLLLVQEERDRVWVELDGALALEELCRCSSVQFTISVNPNEAIEVINRLWFAKVEQQDYAPNDRRWRNYIDMSQANYCDDRYGGPSGFVDLADYVRQLTKHPVVMHNGQRVNVSAEALPDLDVDLFLRSVWWHYRLRKYADTLAVEIRPLARRRDEDFARQWKLVADAIGL